MAKHRRKNPAKQNRAKRPKGPSCGQRVRLMKENFMVLHKAGYTVSKIARMYDLGESTVYDALDEIAAANNVPRESLLWKVKQEAKPATISTNEAENSTGSERSDEQIMPDVSEESVESVRDETMDSDTSVWLPEKEVAEYEENQQVLNGLLEVVTQLEDTLTQVLEEEKRYA